MLPEVAGCGDFAEGVDTEEDEEADKMDAMEEDDSLEAGALVLIEGERRGFRLLSFLPVVSTVSRMRELLAD